MTERTGTLYLATSPSGRRYVGITSRGTEKRWNDHCYIASTGQHTHLACAIRKYGGESFDVQTLVVAPWEELNRLEPLAIVAFGTRSPEGYNLRAGGSQSSPHPETIEKLRIAHLGNRHSAETRAKMSKSHRANGGQAYSSGMLGHTHSEETKAKMSESQKARGPRSPVTFESRRRMSESAKLGWLKRRQGV